MAIHWQVKFKTLRGGKVLTASVYDNTYDGQPIQLKGGAEPFVTEESNDDDPFKAIRTQTGSLNIVDDGYTQKSLYVGIVGLCLKRIPEEYYDIDAALRRLSADLKVSAHRTGEIPLNLEPRSLGNKPGGRAGAAELVLLQ